MVTQPLPSPSPETFIPEHLQAPDGAPPPVGREPAVRAWYRDWVLLGALLSVFVADQATKGLVRLWMVEGEAIPAEGLLRLQYVVNRGSAFGLFQGQTLFLIVASVGGVVLLAFFYRRHAHLSLLLRLGVGLILGGALGNLVDRLLLGGVTDFIAVGWWPNFNLADSSILMGMAATAMALLRPASAPPKGGPSDGRVTDELLMESLQGEPSVSCAEEPGGLTRQ
ncbi:MAG: signal peptidase II [Dehalococcoidia bacterium]|nr:signal peptidase II [Dehalococcoidia bacterium]